MQWISSDLPVLQQESSPIFDGFTAIGVAMSLYASHWQYEAWSVATWLKRVIPFFQHQQLRLFLTEDNVPYGLATWLYLDEAQHQYMLQQANWQTFEKIMSSDEIWAPRKSNRYLWLADFITPFNHALFATEELQAQFSNCKSAWVLNQNPDQALARRVW